MKTIRLSVLFGFMLSLMLVSCGKDDPANNDNPGNNDNGGNNGGNTNTTKATSNFFFIENATYHDAGDMPQGDASLINDLNVNKTVINGGSTIISFTSSEMIKTAYVAVQGVSGYYRYDFDENADYELRSGKTYLYEIILFISQQLMKDNDFVITISCVARNGQQSRPENTEDIKVVEVGTGSLQVSLSWDQLDDVDLHLLEPSGNHIFYGNRSNSDDFYAMWFEFGCYLVNKYTSYDASSLSYDNYKDWDTLDYYLENVPDSAYNEYGAFLASRVKTGGILDLDSNAACGIDGINNENITYNDNPAPGRYYVAVDLFKKCDYSKPGAKYSVTVNYKGQPVTISGKQSGQFDEYDSGSNDSPSQYHIIGGFDIDVSGSIKAVTVTDNPFNGYDDYYGVSIRNAPANAKFKKFLKKQKR